MCLRGVYQQWNASSRKRTWSGSFFWPHKNLYVCGRLLLLLEYATWLFSRHWRLHHFIYCSCCNAFQKARAVAAMRERVDVCLHGHWELFFCCSNVTWRHTSNHYSPLFFTTPSWDIREMHTWIIETTGSAGFDIWLASILSNTAVNLSLYAGSKKSLI